MNDDKIRPNEVPNPHPCSYIVNVDDSDFDDDYFDVLNFCQRHVCRLNGYCKSTKQSKKGKCRFDYPFEKNETTQIIFTTSPSSKIVKATILLRRNDPNVNVHNRTMAHAWRGNIDMQMILDKK